MPAPAIPTSRTAAPVTTPFQRLPDAAAAAIDGLVPVVVINRRLDTALDQVDGPADRPFSTLHDDPRSDPATLARRAFRTINERIRGTHGTGADAGHTVYGSVRFVGADDLQSGAAGVVAALHAQGDIGVRAYGPVSFIADPELIGSRTTYSADDSGITLAKVRPRDGLAEVVAERLERSAGVGSPDPNALLAMPRAAARDAIRGWLMSSHLAGSDTYIEAQVRRLENDDLMAATVDTRDFTDISRRHMIDPGAAVDASNLVKLDAELADHRIPTWHVAGPSAPITPAAPASG